MSSGILAFDPALILPEASRVAAARSRPMPPFFGRGMNGRSAEVTSCEGWGGMDVRVGCGCEGWMWASHDGRVDRCVTLVVRGSVG